MITVSSRRVRRVEVFVTRNGSSAICPARMSMAATWPLRSRRWPDAGRRAGKIWRCPTRSVSYYVNFAVTGDPNGKGFPPWPAFTDKNQQLMVFEPYFDRVRKENIAGGLPADLDTASTATATTATATAASDRDKLDPQRAFAAVVRAPEPTSIKR